MKKQKAPDLFLCNKRNPINPACKICSHNVLHEQADCKGICLLIGDGKFRCLKQKKTRKKPETTNTRIRASLRKLFMTSRERAAAKKRCNSSCVQCGKKESKAKGREVKVEVHHKDQVLNWQKIFEVVKQYLLCDPALMEVLCEECHDKLHKSEES